MTYTSIEQQGNTMSKIQIRHRDSIESHAESWAIGIVAVGIALAMAAAFIALVKAGYAQHWWPL